jgi:hypothetical protein
MTKRKQARSLAVDNLVPDPGFRGVLDSIYGSKASRAPK